MVNERSVEGVKIVVTGANGGIGGAAAGALRAAGAAVAGIDVCPGDGVLVADVTDAGRVRDAMAEAARLLGGIDVLVNSAGIGAPQDAGALPDAEARRVLEVNFFGTWNATAAAMPELLAARGQVVNVVSGLALVGMPYAAAYAASKRAVEAYSTALCMEYGDRLTVTDLYPGYVRTLIHARSLELGVTLEGVARPETVEQVAAAVVRACRRRPRRLAVTWRSAAEFWYARHWPSLVERIVGARVRSALADLPAPTFLRDTEAGRT